MKKKIILSAVYAILVSFTGVGVYLFLDNREKSNQDNTSQIRQVLPAFEDRQQEFLSSSTDINPETIPEVPNPTQLEQLNPDKNKDATVTNKPTTQQPQSKPIITTPVQPTTPSVTQTKPEEKKIEIVEQKPEDRGNFDDQKGAYDEKKVK